MSGFAPLAAIFPEGSHVNRAGHLVLGGCDTLELVAQFGSPLYVFDEDALRDRCREYLREFGAAYPDVAVLYACKAFINRGLARLLHQEGLGLDVVSGGEMAIAQAAGFPMGQVYLHGNNKGEEELQQALTLGVGRVVVDNFHELALLEELTGRAGTVQDVLLRLAPGIDPHTHAYTTTGIIDSKFGFPLSTGQAEAALVQALASPHLRLVGLHFHLGSPIFTTEPYQQAIAFVLDFAATMAQRHGSRLQEFSPGGGFAIQYQREAPAPPTAVYARAIGEALVQGCQERGLPLPRLIVEPGRAIVGRAGVALYTVGSRKEIPGVRTYVSVDGGMADNIRPALYGARYEALVANKAQEEPTQQVTVAGKFCESGDILLPEALLPPLSPGDLLAVPASGAYCLAMASNYNASPRPAIVLVKDGQPRLLRRRETHQDLLRYDEE